MWLALAFSAASLNAAMQCTASSSPFAAPTNDGSVLVSHPKNDGAGNTSLRFVADRKVDANKYPTNGVTAFAHEAREQPQRDRDLGQTFLAGPRRARLDSLCLRVGLGTSGVLSNAPGARIAVQWFEVTGTPRLNDHGTPGYAGRFDRVKSPELDDYVEGETYRPIHVAEGRLPAVLRKGDYLRFQFTGDDAITLEPNRCYAFLLLFVDRAAGRSLALANEYYGSYTPDLRNRWLGHGVRREGSPAFPDDWKARLDQQPGTLGFPDVCTFRDLYFIITATSVK